MPAFVEVNPRYEIFLKNQGLSAPEDFLDLPATIVSGHPDRHVARVVLGRGPNTLKAFLKKEHRVPWRDRLVNALAGFGLCSKSYREAAMLRKLKYSGIGGPEFLAVGEDGKGRAFLLLRELAAAVDLRHYLSDCLPTRPLRYRFGEELGKTLARMHGAGFYHRDLYAKHILVVPAANSNSADHPGYHFSILDWQRSRRQRHVSWAKRWRDLAAVDATLVENLANSRDRFACLHAYLSTTLGQPTPLPFFHRAGRAIRQQTLMLLRRRKIREMRQPPLAEKSQHLVWLKGEELCVTQEFHQATTGQMLASLISLVASKTRPRQQCSQEIIISGAGPAILISSRRSRPIWWLLSWIRRRPLISAEQEKAAIIFRLERHGVSTPQLLAFGQRPVTWGTESFLLIKKLEQTRPFAHWLADQLRFARITENKQIRASLREAGTLLRRMHDAHCYIRANHKMSLEVQAVPGEAPRLVLGALDGIYKRRRRSRALAVKNLRTVLRSLASAKAGRSDCLRFLLNYLGQKRLTAGAKPLIRRLLASTRRKPRIEHCPSAFDPQSSIHNPRIQPDWRVAG